MSLNNERLDYLNQFDLSYNYFQNIPSITDKYCVIIEPREHPMLIKVIKNFMYLLQNKGWGLIIIHGNDNKKILKKHLHGWKNIKYVNLFVSNLNIQQYNYIMTNIELWECIKIHGCKYALIFQCDTVLLKDDVDDYLNYDFIGAPWCAEMNGIKGGYNGGLSMRNVNTMINIIRQGPSLLYSNLNSVNEDIYFAFYMEKNQNKYKLSNRDVAKSFSVETVYYHDPSGMHQPHINKFPNKAEYTRILSKRYEIE